MCRRVWYEACRQGLSPEFQVMRKGLPGILHLGIVPITHGVTKTVIDNLGQHIANDIRKHAVGIVKIRIKVKMYADASRPTAL